VAMFIGTLTGSAGYDEERCVCSIMHSLEPSGTTTGRSKVADIDDVQLRLLSEVNYSDSTSRNPTST
jgi:hypothetical protein